MAYELHTSPKVYFGAGFHSHAGRDHAGSRLDLGCRVIWDGVRVTVPAVYLCAGGPVLDLLLQVERTRIEDFERRWGDALRTGTALSQEQRLFMCADDPFYPDVSLRMMANDKALTPVRMDAARFNPSPAACPPATPEADALMDFYNCDPADGWLFLRASFGWATRKKPAVHTLSLTLARQALLIPGLRFDAVPGTAQSFLHPVTGIEHRLSVLSCLPEDAVRRLRCAVTPPLPRDALLLHDRRLPLPEAETPQVLGSSADTDFFEGLSAPGTGADWQLYFRIRRASPVTLMLSDDRRL